MKKQIALLILLLTLSVTALCMIGASVSRESDRVTITEQALYGDPAVAEDATLTLDAHLNEHQRWTTIYTPGGESRTEYLFSAKEMIFERDFSAVGIQLYDDIRFGYDLSISLEETTGIQRAYRELYDATAPGTKGTKTVRLQDYYEYYPIRVDIGLPGTLWRGVHYDQLAEEDFKNERAVWNAFREFFKIPIPKQLASFEISLTKSESGSETGIGHGFAEDGLHYSLYAESAYTSDRCFFTINNWIGEDYVDTSLIPGGYGIYSFSYTNVRNKENTRGNATVFHPGYLTGVDADSLAMVYPLPQDVHVYAMHISPDESRLLLLTEDRTGANHLVILDIATMTELQKFHVSDRQYVVLNHLDDFLLLFHDRHISVYTLDKGTYSFVFTVDQPGVVNENFSDINPYAAMDFDGERLILADLLPESQYRNLQTCNLCLAVCDSTGLLYYGEYRNSLSTNPDTSHYSYNSEPLTLHVTWNP